MIQTFARRRRAIFFGFYSVKLNFIIKIRARFAPEKSKFLAPKIAISNGKIAHLVVRK